MREGSEKNIYNSESVNQRMTDHTMAKRKRTKG